MMLTSLKNVVFRNASVLKQKPSCRSLGTSIGINQSFSSLQKSTMNMTAQSIRRLCNTNISNFSISSPEYFRRLTWFSHMNNQCQNEEHLNLLKKKEKALLKALKNKYQLEFESLEKIQKHHFDLLEECCSDCPENKIQSPRFNQVKKLVFKIHQDQIEIIQEAMDVKKILMLQSETKDAFEQIGKLNDIMHVETKYHEEQINTIKQCIAELNNMMQDIEKTYGKDEDDKNLALMKIFVTKHEQQLKEQIQRHEEILQRYKRFIQINIE
ncbi:uncharacterized protein LOC113467947 isoform X1 [Diaphorina citri]|uniref:Uncharacterized protein LOC113467947 isoform X1 n=1 Tax=Diaphorina citri TaxID=121845 RepID=A0A3Q0IZZ9_DIACI|nr:uncharacterized protein LOC113467947 isoform X1 [Diaphorina citri]